MQPGRPSTSANHVACRRAAHQLLDDPRVFEDPVAFSVLEASTAAELRANPRRMAGLIANPVRAYMAARSRYAEDALAAAVARGVRQYVLLGAGLDTFAYRNPYPDVRVFEVDYPATQALKRTRLEQGGVAIPPSLTFVPMDFLEQTLADGLRSAGFRTDVPTFFAWLGVTMYLSREAIFTTLRLARQLPKGSGIVFDYMIPRSHMTLFQRVVFTWYAYRLAAGGESFASEFDPASLVQDVAALGFTRVEDVNAATLNALYFSGRKDGLRVRTLTHLICAEV
jgi:methyltransferase (TIGR00027 family)